MTKKDPPGSVVDLSAKRAERAWFEADQFGDARALDPAELVVIDVVDQLRSSMMTVCSEIAPRLVRIETAAEVNQILSAGIAAELDKFAAEARAAAACDDDPDAAQ